MQLLQSRSDCPAHIQSHVLSSLCFLHPSTHALLMKDLGTDITAFRNHPDSEHLLSTLIENQPTEYLKADSPLVAEAFHRVGKWLQSNAMYTQSSAKCRGMMAKLVKKLLPLIMEQDHYFVGMHNKAEHASAVFHTLCGLYSARNSSGINSGSAALLRRTEGGGGKKGGVEGRGDEDEESNTRLLIEIINAVVELVKVRARTLSLTLLIFLLTNLSISFSMCSSLKTFSFSSSLVFFPPLLSSSSFLVFFPSLPPFSSFLHAHDTLFSHVSNFIHYPYSTVPEISRQVTRSCSKLQPCYALPYTMGEQMSPQRQRGQWQRYCPLWRQLWMRNLSMWTEIHMTSKFDCVTCSDELSERAIYICRDIERDQLVMWYIVDLFMGCLLASVAIALYLWLITSFFPSHPT